MTGGESFKEDHRDVSPLLRGAIKKRQYEGEPLNLTAVEGQKTLDGKISRTKVSWRNRYSSSKGVRYVFFKGKLGEWVGYWDCEKKGTTLKQKCRRSTAEHNPITESKNSGDVAR